MSDEKTNTNPAPAQAGKAKPMTAAEAAKRVKCDAADVLDWRDYGTHVVVVTRDGQKLTSQGE